MLQGIHHIAIICSNYEKSKYFYSKILGLEIIAENFQIERQSYKLDLKLPDGTRIELFSFTDAPERPSFPEAQGLRHLAFRVLSVEEAVKYLSRWDILIEPIRVDEFSGKKFTFFHDPDKLPLELYES